jgi:hypothetical protein
VRVLSPLRASALPVLKAQGAFTFYFLESPPPRPSLTVQCNEVASSIPKLELETYYCLEVDKTMTRMFFKYSMVPKNKEGLSVFNL